METTEKKLEEIYTFKKQFEEADVADLTAWFEARMDKLPQELQLSNSTHSVNLTKTVKMMLGVVRQKGTSPTFGGYMAHLALIRERLKEQGME